ncbi:large subunit ribosomal protein L25 [Humitalea rosea]|uniref:Large ribosomal subunit protein bL25 n=1 Tax=Humitalea rosea TaxID=990373 RepID=A0A2W7J2D5_9PROT|nr:50S ribosomal protein L25/general stress protein Ctc [Humitalea rosea]PZW45749.1 large subunit ribosomal protein L25 [Humitalea rosea]
MVQIYRIPAVAREQAGKGAARATRRSGLVPGVIYGAKLPSTMVSLDPRVVMKELHKGGWQSHLYDIEVEGGSTERVLMREVQFHPVSDKPLHVDFQRLAPGARIKVKVPVAFTNEDICPGLKAGGVLNVVRREIEVLAEPANVPEAFHIDLSEANIGASLRLSMIKDLLGAKSVIQGRDFMVASIAAPTVDADLAPPPPPPEPVKGKGKAAAKPAAAAPAAAKPAAKKK